MGSYLPNAWGLYDMHGNVQEWCLDLYVDAPPGTVDPVGGAKWSSRVLRGGGWTTSASGCRSAYRNMGVPSGQGSELGFRITSNLP